MQVISKVYKEFIVDRVTTHSARIIIDIQQISKDDNAKIFTFRTNDSYITDDENVYPIIQKVTNSQSKTYVKTYEEYQQEKDYLKGIHENDADYILLTNDAERDDYLLVMGLLLNLQLDPIYGIDGLDWEVRVLPEEQPEP